MSYQDKTIPRQNQDVLKMSCAGWVKITQAQISHVDNINKFASNLKRFLLEYKHLISAKVSKCRSSFSFMLSLECLHAPLGHFPARQFTSSYPCRISTTETVQTLQTGFPHLKID